MSSVYHYAQRILNPYRGVRHSIEIENAHAATTNGQEWILYITDTSCLRYVDHNSLTPAYTSHINYGTWSREQGFQRAALLSTVDYDGVEDLGQELLNQVRLYEAELPFYLNDRYELWMLDNYYQPMAILESRIHPPTGHESVMKRWNTGQICRETCFDSSICNILERAVKKLAHKEKSYTWFERRGNMLVPLEEAGPVSSVEAPLLLLREQWPEADLTSDVREYLRWQAPYLLMLEGLSAELRRGLEQAAALQPYLTASLYRLYPEIEDESLMNSVRVQARLQQSD